MTTTPNSDSDMQFVAKNEKDVWQTPDRLLDPIQQYVGIDVDPCAGPDTDIGTVNIRPPTGDGLTDPWAVEGVESPTAFVNPPFSQKVEFLDRGIHQYESGNVGRVIFVTPDSTDVQSWWHGRIVPHCDYTWFPEGRVDYVDPQTGEQQSGVSFGTAVSFIGSVPDDLLEYMAERGDVVHRPRF